MAKTNFVVTPGAGAKDRRVSRSRLSARGIEHPGNHGVRMIATTRYSAILSKSYPEGTALATNIAPIRKRGNGRQGLIVSEANVLRIRSKESGKRSMPSWQCKEIQEVLPC
jgi:hypothetical protein